MFLKNPITQAEWSLEHFLEDMFYEDCPDGCICPEILSNEDCYKNQLDLLQEALNAVAKERECS